MSTQIFTARKRSLGQSNTFSSVCQEFCSQGGVPRQVLPSPRAGTPPWAGTPPGQVHPPEAVHAGRYEQQEGGTHSTGMHSCCFTFGIHCSHKKTLSLIDNSPQY